MPPIRHFFFAITFLDNYKNDCIKLAVRDVPQGISN